MERTLYTGQDCYRCHVIKPYVEKYTDKHGIKLQILEVAGDSEIITVPTLITNNNGDKELLGYDDILSLITNDINDSN